MNLDIKRGVLPRFLVFEAANSISTSIYQYIDVHMMCT